MQIGWSASLSLSIAGFLAVGAIAAAQHVDERKEALGSQAEIEGPPVLHVLVHRPGPTWKPGVSFREQPGIEEHVRYMAGLLDQGLMVMGGPFLDDSGGMMVSRLPTLEEARRVAEADPAVRSGLLEVEVKAWLVAMRSVDPG